VSTYGPKTWLVIHPEMVMTQEWWVCHRCEIKTPGANKQATDLKCGHKKDRKTKHQLDHSYPKLFQIQWGAIVADEAHEYLIRRSGKPTQKRRGMEHLTVRGDGTKIEMSGTPFDGKPHQLWGALNWVDPIGYSAFHRWAETYWRKGGYTGHEIGEFRKDREDLLWDSLSGVALRRTKEEVAPDLPPKMYVGSPLIPGRDDSPVGIWLSMEDKQLAAYQEMEAMSWADLDSGRLEAVTALAELTRLKQLACCYGELEERLVRWHCKDPNCPSKETYQHLKPNHTHSEWRQFYKPTLPSNKFDWIIERLDEWGYPKTPVDKVVIVSFYSGILRTFAHGINAHFRTKLCTGITGKTPAKLRPKIIEAFNSTSRDSPKIMMLNVRAGGTAITIDSADRMILISETRNPDQQSQAEDRIHRVSNPRHCMYYYLRSLGTVDVGTALVNEEVKRDSHRLLDGRRGLEYMRKVMELSGDRP
jgi:SNF2 family DNA or RNA helicase